jgi:hypothetical protein
MSNDQSVCPDLPSLIALLYHSKITRHRIRPGSFESIPADGVALAGAVKLIRNATGYEKS